MPSILLNAILPLGLGIFASFAVWFIIASIKPKIIIDEIFLEPTASKSKYCYRLKVINDGSFNVYDVTVSGRIVLKVESKDLIVPIRTHVINVGNGKSPYIPGTRESSDVNLRTRWYMLSIPRYTKENLERLAAEFVVKHKEDVHIDDLYDIFLLFPEADFLVSITATHLFSASRNVISKVFRKLDIDEIADKRPAFSVDENVSILRNNKHPDKPYEDCVEIDTNNKIYILLDGVSRDITNGEYPEGELVTGIVKLMSKHIRLFIVQALEKSKQHNKRISIHDVLYTAIYTANSTILAETSKYEFKPGATALVCLIYGSTFYYAYIGDCIGLLIRKGHNIRTFTECQTDNIRNYQLWHRQLYGKSLSKDIIRNKICNDPSNPLGYGVLDGNPKAMDFLKISHFTLFDKDIILLSSDGIKNYIDSHDFPNIDFEGKNAKEIISASNQYDTVSDDKSVIILRVKKAKI